MTRRTKWRKARGLKEWSRTFLGLRLRVLRYPVGSGTAWKWAFMIGANGVSDVGYASMEGAQNAAEIRARLIVE